MVEVLRQELEKCRDQRNELQQVRALDERFLWLVPGVCIDRYGYGLCCCSCCRSSTARPVGRR